MKTQMVGFLLLFYILSIIGVFFTTVDALVYLCYKSKVAQNEKRKKLFGFSYSKKYDKFWSISLDNFNLFLKNVPAATININILALFFSIFSPLCPPEASPFSE